MLKTCAREVIDEFVNRDLFNVTNLELIQWRIKGKKLTSHKVSEYLKSTDGKKSLNALLEHPNSEKKVREWFNMDDFDDLITDNNIDSFIDNYFNIIFK